VLALPHVAALDEAHAGEHCLEVQLPFLQCVLERFSMLPLVVGSAAAAQVAEVIDLVWNGPSTLVVVSSDLSHYYDYATAQRLDQDTARAIERLDAGALDSESACGRVPIRGLLLAARARGLRATTLDLRSSGDTAGPRTRVVGYGAFAFDADAPSSS
jgi:AmmeMemoRadiSam system protein B